MAITTRSGKGSPLTHNEMDANLSAITEKTSATGSVKGSSGTTAQRPASPVEGYTRFNTTLNRHETYNGSTWITAVSSANTDTSDMSFVVDEDAMTSDSATKVPTQQSVKAYVDSQVQSKDALSELSGTLDDVADGTTYVKSTNDFTDAEVTKLSGIETAATADQTNAEIKTAYEANADTNEFSDAEQTKLAGIETAATADQSQAEIKTAYEANTNTNAYTDTEKSKLAGVESGADVTDTTNVTSAGALMDSEVTNLAQVKAFDTTDYATSTQGTTADNALPLAGGTMTGNITLGTNTIDGLEINTTATNNLGLGTGAVDSITTGDYNVGVGDNALTANTTGYRNTASGYQSLYSNTTGNNNTASGYQALKANTTGLENVAVGQGSLYSNTTASYNTAVGRTALYNNTTGGNNAAVGAYSLYSNTTASYNSSMGVQALFNNSTGNNNTANGYKALYSNTTGLNNTANGYEALYSNTTANNNTASGYRALRFNTTGNGNVANGIQVLYNNTTGANNTAVGYNSLQTNTTGANNTALGYGAGDNITTGSSNIIIGAGIDAPSASASNQLNIGNTIYGNTSTGFVGIGTSSPSAKLHVENAAAAAELWLQRTGYTAVKLYGSTLGDGNGFKINVGGADRLNIDSSGNVGLGADPSAARFNIESASECAHFDRTDADGTLIRFRRSGFTKGSITISGSTTAYNTSSDYRLKENIVPMTGSIDRLKNLNPSKFNFIGTSNVVDGFLAHEAGEVVPEAIYGTKDAMTAEVLYTAEDELPEGMNIGDVKEASAPDYQGIDQSKLVPLLVSALQEAIARIEVLENA